MTTADRPSRELRMVTSDSGAVRLETVTDPPGAAPAAPRRRTIPPAVGRSLGVVALVLGALGGGAGVSELVRLVRGDRQQAIIDRLDGIGRRIDGVQADVAELRREVGTVQRRSEADDAARRATADQMRSLLRERPPATAQALRVLDE